MIRIRFLRMTRSNMIISPMTTCCAEGLKVMDAAGIALAKDDDKPIMVLNMNVPGNIRKAVCGEKVGTLISSREPQMMSIV